MTATIMKTMSTVMATMRVSESCDDDEEVDDNDDEDVDDNDGEYPLMYGQ